MLLRRHPRVCDVLPLQIRKTESRKEVFQKGAVCCIYKYVRSDSCIFQYTEPERFLLTEDLQPPVKSGNSYPILAADLFYRGTSDKVSPQYGKQETQGIRPVWDDTGRQGCMRMSAGITDISWNGNRVGILRVSIPFHEISFIVTEKAQTSPRRAVWAGLVRRQRNPAGMIKPFSV